MEKLIATVKRVVVQSPDIKTIYFLLEDGWKLEYEAGQYITVYKPDSSVTQGKAYSLSSAPHEKWMSITVKEIGEYSRYLCELRAGDTFLISRAYGHFKPAIGKPIIALAAGVGIAPIISIIKDKSHQGSNQTVDLYYSNKLSDGIAHRDQLQASGATVVHYITSGVPERGMRGGRIVARECAQVASDVAYLVCGGISFVKDMWEGLVGAGVAPEAISTETFFES